MTRLWSAHKVHGLSSRMAGDSSTLPPVSVLQTLATVIPRSARPLPTSV